MNLASMAVLTVIAVLFAWAVYHMVKNRGGCASCGHGGSCPMCSHEPGCPICAKKASKAVK